VGEGTAPDFRDGRDIRAFTPVFDGLLPAMTEWELHEFCPCFGVTRAPELSES